MIRKLKSGDDPVVLAQSQSANRKTAKPGYSSARARPLKNTNAPSSFSSGTD